MQDLESTPERGHFGLLPKSAEQVMTAFRVQLFRRTNKHANRAGIGQNNVQ
jgi:hypothetical protein